MQYYVFMKKLKILFIFTTALFCLSCSVNRIITSNYKPNSTFISGAYTSYYNDSIGISEDLYAAYKTDIESFTIDNNIYNNDRAVVKDQLNILLSPKHLLFHVNSRLEDATTQLFYVPGIQLPDKAIKDYKFRKRYYNIYSIYEGGGQLVQVFSIPEDLRKKEKVYSRFSKECDAIIAKLCYGDYYKISYWNDSKLTIDLSQSLFYKRQVSLIDLFDKNDLLDISSRTLVAIPSNRTKVTVTFKFSDLINKKYKKQDLYITVYDREDFIQKGQEATSLLNHKLKTKPFTSSFEISYSNYILMVMDKNNNILELVLFSIW